MNDFNSYPMILKPKDVQEILGWRINDVYIDFELKRLIAAVKELLREEDDRKEILELEKRYTKGMAVKGSD